MKSAIVTGANRGLGKSVASSLVSEGWRVFLACRTPPSEALMADLSKLSGEAIPIELDVGSPASITAAVESLVKPEDSGFDVVIQNAGVLFEEHTKERYDTTMAINFEGPKLLTAALLPHLNTGANVVFVSSGLGSRRLQLDKHVESILAAPSIDDLSSVAPFDEADAAATRGNTRAIYGLSKAKLNRMMEMYAADEALKARGITFSAVCPDWCRTDMGGAEATTSVEKGAESILWNARNAPDGGFFRHGKALSM